MKRSLLAQGVHLNVLPFDKFTTDLLSVYLITPLSPQTAAANALLAEVLQRGCRAYPDMTRLARRQDELYGATLGTSVRKMGDRQVIGLHAESVSQRYAMPGDRVLAETVELLGQLLTDPLLENGLLKEAWVESEKTHLLHRIDEQFNNKGQYAMLRLVEEMCAAEPFGVPRFGRKEEIAALNAHTLTQRYRELLAQARIEIFFCGREEEDLEALLRPLFSAPRTPVDCPNSAPHRGQAPLREICERFPVTQGKLAMGFRLGTCSADGGKDTAAAQLFVNLYGGSPSSKLFANVREKMSLCYYCSAQGDLHKGLLFVNSGIEVENRSKAQDEILRQLEQIQNGQISAEEYGAALKSYLNDLKGIYDSASALSGWYLSRLLGGYELMTPEARAKEFESLTPADVAAAARRVSADTFYFLEGTAREEDSHDR